MQYCNIQGLYSICHLYDISFLHCSDLPSHFFHKLKLMESCKGRTFLVLCGKLWLYFPYKIRGRNEITVFVIQKQPINPSIGRKVHSLGNDGYKSKRPS
jgi:hypothetical protein